MDRNAQKKLIEWLENGQTDLALNFVRNIKVTGSKRTNQQNAAYWVWLSMIEHEAENQGVTWDMVVGEMNQLRVTKENVHEAVKQLTKALWGIESTTQLEKIGHMDIVIDHVTALFGKVGLEVPAFPHEENKGNDRLEAMKLREKINYPSN